MNREHHLSETSSINASVVSRAKYDSSHNDNQKKRTRTRRRNRKSVFSAMKELIRGPQRLWSVLLFSVIATLGSVVTGITLGYSSPAGPSVLSQLSVTKDWNSWGNSVFGALSNVGAVFGSFIAIFIADRVGRKDTLIFANIPTVIGYLFIICASRHQSPGSEFGVFLVFLYVGRLLTGIGAGWTSVVVPMYVVEISPAVGKGLFGALNQLAITIGILAIEAFGIGNILKYYHLAILPMTVILLFTVLGIFLRETPRWLLSKGQIKESTRVLQLLRGTQYDKEVDELQSAIHAEEGNFFSKIRFLRQKPSFLALIFSVLLMVFQQLCGPNAFVFFASRILRNAGATPLTASIETSIGIGLIQVVATTIAVIVVDIVGRKVLLFIGSIGSLLTSIVMGIYFILFNAYDIHPPDKIPIVCIAIFIIVFSLGWAPVPWLMINELSPTKVRAVVAGIATAVNWSLAALVTGIFDVDSVEKHSYLVYWSFAFMSFLSIVFVLFLPETKGRSLQEIENDLAHYRPFHCRQGLC